jgi:D-glycero-beta-D-manno-heptose 1-phosphate adenylyltransferase
MAQAPAFETKLCPPAELDRRVSELPRPLVFTNGVFDILHRGRDLPRAGARAGL